MAFNDKLARILSNLDSAIDKAVEDATRNLAAEAEFRIFDKGLDAKENQIGQYSTKPLLIGAKSFKDKSWANQFFNSEEAFTDDTQGFRKVRGKTLYLLPGGYRKFRSLNGLRNGFVDLTFSANLKKTIVHNEHQVYFKNEYGVKVSGGNEKRFGKRIFAPSNKEARQVIDYLNEALKEIW